MCFSVLYVEGKQISSLVLRPQCDANISIANCMVFVMNIRILDIDVGLLGCAPLLSTCKSVRRSNPEA
jgi:hypothetical protein